MCNCVKKCSVFTVLSLAGNATNQNVKFQWGSFPFFLPGHNAERIGEIIQYVYVRPVNLLKHSLIRFDTLVRLKRNLGQTKSKAMLDHPTFEQEKIYFYCQGGNLTK